MARPKRTNTTEKKKFDESSDLVHLEYRVESVEETARRHDIQIEKLDSAVADLREALARVATKTDVAELRKDITDTFAQAARDAQNSIPVKITAWFTGAMLIMAILGIFASMFHSAH